MALDSPSLCSPSRLGRFTPSRKALMPSLAVLLFVTFLASGVTLAVARGDDPAVTPGAVDAPLTGSFVASFDSASTIVVDTSGTPSGRQVGPYKLLTLPEAERGKRLRVGVVQASSQTGTLLPAPPIRLYRLAKPAGSLNGPLAAFGESQSRDLVVVAQSPAGESLEWEAQPGDYLVFFGRPVPIVRVAGTEVMQSLEYRVSLD